MHTIDQCHSDWDGKKEISPTPKFKFLWHSLVLLKLQVDSRFAILALLQIND